MNIKLVFYLNYMYISAFLGLSVLYTKKQVNGLFVLFTGECFYSGPGLTALVSASIVLGNFCPLCY